MANPCVLYHRVKDIIIVVHGDDFPALGADVDLDWHEQTLPELCEIKLRSCLGEGCPGPQEIRILNRVVSVDSNGLTYEADPRTWLSIDELTQSKLVELIGDPRSETS